MWMIRVNRPFGGIMYLYSTYHKVNRNVQIKSHVWETELRCVLLFLSLYLFCMFGCHTFRINFIYKTKSNHLTTGANNKQSRHAGTKKQKPIKVGPGLLELITGAAAHCCYRIRPRYDVTADGGRGRRHRQTQRGTSVCKTSICHLLPFQRNQPGVQCVIHHRAERWRGGNRWRRRRRRRNDTHTKRKKENRVWRTHPQKPSAGAGPKTKVWRKFDLCFRSQRHIFPVTAVCHSDISVCKCPVLDLFRHSNHVMFDAWSERRSRATSEKQQRVEKSWCQGRVFSLLSEAAADFKMCFAIESLISDHRYSPFSSTQTRFPLASGRDGQGFKVPAM